MHTHYFAVPGHEAGLQPAQVASAHCQQLQIVSADTLQVVHGDVLSTPALGCSFDTNAEGATESATPAVNLAPVPCPPARRRRPHALRHMNSANEAGPLKPRHRQLRNVQSTIGSKRRLALSPLAASQEMATPLSVRARVRRRRGSSLSQLGHKTPTVA